MPENELGQWELSVGEDDDGLRADLWLKKQIPTLSRREAQRLCEEGAVTQDGRPLRKADPVAAGALIQVHRDSADAAEPAPEVAVEVVWETPQVLVVNKEAGVPSAAIRGKTRGTMAGALLARYPELATVGFGRRDPGLVHRLDTYTSGLIVAAKSQTAFEELRALLKAGKWDKRYLALVQKGDLDSRGKCALPLEPDPRNRRRVRVAKHGGFPCLSTFEIVMSGARFDLVEVRASSAYRHQVRAHLAALGAPLVGDELYGGPSANLGPRHALHASYIAIEAAGLSGVSCPLPEDLRALIEGES